MKKIIQVNHKYRQIYAVFEKNVDQYLISLRESYKHDKKLANYFAENWDKMRFNIVYARMQLIVKEMEDIMAKKGKK